MSIGENTCPPREVEDELYTVVEEVNWKPVYNI